MLAPSNSSLDTPRSQIAHSFLAFMSFFGHDLARALRQPLRAETSIPNRMLRLPCSERQYQSSASFETSFKPDQLEYSAHKLWILKSSCDSADGKVERPQLKNSGRLKGAS